MWENSRNSSDHWKNRIADSGRDRRRSRTDSAWSGRRRSERGIRSGGEPWAKECEIWSRVFCRLLGFWGEEERKRRRRREERFLSSSSFGAGEEESISI